MDRYSHVPSSGPLSSPPSEELLHRARRGDQGALNRLLERYLPRLRRWAHRRVPDWARGGADTADYVQDTVLQSLRQFGRFEPTRDGAFLNYLRRSLVNRVRTQFRSASRRPASVEIHESVEDTSASPLDLVIEAQDRKRYEAALGRLERDQRRAVVASVELGYSYEQIALMLDKPSAEAARQTVRRALVRLGKEMSRGA